MHTGKCEIFKSFSFSFYLDIRVYIYSRRVLCPFKTCVSRVEFVDKSKENKTSREKIPTTNWRCQNQSTEF